MEKHLKCETKHISLIHVHIHPRDYTVLACILECMALCMDGCMYFCLRGWLYASSRVWMTECMDHCVHGFMCTQCQNQKFSLFYNSTFAINFPF